MMDDMNRSSLPKVSQLRMELARVQRRNRVLRAVRSVLMMTLLLAVIVVLAFLWLGTHTIEDESMLPTLRAGDVVLSMRDRQTERGDLILFNAPDGSRLVRRVIAVTGDEVNILEDGTVTVNGAPLSEAYAVNLSRGEGDFPLPYVVPSGRCFVLCDNRTCLQDSRTMEIGSVREEQIVGRVAVRIWPLSDLESFLAG